MKWIRYFMLSAGGILMVSAVERFFVAGGNAQVLALPDPMVGIPLRYPVIAVGALELVVALICLYGKSIETTKLNVRAAGGTGHFQRFGGFCSLLLKPEPRNCRKTAREKIEWNERKDCPDPSPRETKWVSEAVNAGGLPMAMHPERTDSK